MKIPHARRERLPVRVVPGRITGPEVTADVGTDFAPGSGSETETLPEGLNEAFEDVDLGETALEFS